MASLKEKLCLSAIEHFALVLEHVKSLKRNKLTLLDYEQTLVKVNKTPPTLLQEPHQQHNNGLLSFIQLPFLGDSLLTTSTVPL